MKKPFLSLIFTLIFLTSCADRTGSGALLGGATGAILGSNIGGGDGRVASTAIGALIGFYVGGKIGEYMDEQDKFKAQQTTYMALEKGRTGETKMWRNPDNGHYGSVTPKKTYESHDGRYCREYTHRVTIAGKTESAYGTACRQEDGSWKIA